MAEIYVMDACALVALLKKEEGADIVVDAYQKAKNGTARLYKERKTI